MSAAADHRVRRPKAMEDVLALLTSKDNGSTAVFPQLRDALVFAAAVGWTQGKRTAFDNSGEAIRWDVASNRRGTEMLVNLLAIATHPDDPEVMSSERFAERLLIFEEYVNGGLIFIKEQLESAPGTPTEVILRLTESALAAGTDDEPPGLDDLLDGIL